MKSFGLVVGVWFWFLLAFTEYATLDNSVKDPTVIVAILARNKRHILPYFLTLLSKIDYPKDRITLWIRTDHNVDETKKLLDDWISREEKTYHRIDFKVEDDSEAYPLAEWTELRMRHVIRLREDALNDSRRCWADYLWVLDCDALITDSSTLRHLISSGHAITAPMLLSNEWYSNFWCGMTESYYYKRTEDYAKILHYQRIGCHRVPMIYSAVLIDLKKFTSDKLTYTPSKIGPEYNGPIDDIIVFAISATRAGIPLHICNDKLYGFITQPLDDNESLSDDEDRLFDLKIRAYDYGHPFPVDEALLKYTRKEVQKPFTLNKVFVINLLRRPEKRNRTNYILNELAVEHTFIDAVDGSILQDSDLQKMGIVPLAEYKDPYHKRPMKKGEIGCFLSHMMIWNEIIENQYKHVLVLEDDIQVSADFVFSLENLMKELTSVKWDLVYLGRKIMNTNMERSVEGTRSLVYPDYSYWTLAYLLSLEGARKLVDAKPLEKLIPIDEYLPIMYDKHPRSNWANYFPQRNLVALSANPLIVYPMKYLNEEGYVSDTEDSSIINQAFAASNGMDENEDVSIINETAEAPIDIGENENLSIINGTAEAPIDIGENENLSIINGTAEAPIDIGENENLSIINEAAEAPIDIGENENLSIINGTAEAHIDIRENLSIINETADAPIDIDENENLSIINGTAEAPIDSAENLSIINETAEVPIDIGENEDLSIINEAAEASNGVDENEDVSIIDQAAEASNDINKNGRVKDEF